MKTLKEFTHDLEQGTRFLLVTIVLFYACTLIVYVVQWGLSLFTSEINADLGSALITAYFLIILSVIIGAFFEKLRT
ncbi:hypothetical protein PsalMR5_04841 (plasmid) [Piscirickettsia salmonis]|uniref:hypothetical protein n=1 Tax=Piscirickettsia salmonis TaxID=1238 RepID=UPI0012BB0C0E|nr:hypothetical protein [Piscirickettsia salmonis]QGP56885.1 hypothetical protein PsalSR1_04374 [Piscirickettsia salmonis]QGP62164.1 hypothetical protein PsalBI1_04806 [Piscirickettsia salmonis]QGP66916.1 hypothetical protein PsalMR5_04841 [Piscirickettsia salmonis]